MAKKSKKSIKKVKGGYKVAYKHGGPTGHKKYASKKPMSREAAMRQLAAIKINMHK